MLRTSAIRRQHSYLRSPENCNYRAITSNAWSNWRTILYFRYIALSSLSLFSLSFCNSRAKYIYHARTHTRTRTQSETSVENIFRLKCSKDVRRANFTMQLHRWNESFPFNVQSLNSELVESTMITFRQGHSKVKLLFESTLTKTTYKDGKLQTVARFNYQLLPRQFLMAAYLQNLYTHQHDN
jgi:hypothetical protein